MKVIILATMLFLHIVDDYYLQGILANFKQRKWWEEAVPDFSHSLYRNDYKIALIEHGFSWAFMMMLPVTILTLKQGDSVWIPWYILFISNWIVHTYTDHLKANVQNIGLLTDQIIHISQVIATWAIACAGMMKGGV